MDLVWYGWLPAMTLTEIQLTTCSGSGVIFESQVGRGVATISVGPRRGFASRASPLEMTSSNGPVRALLGTVVKIFASLRLL